jgi:DNA-binding Lrp family transcriptional regulator
MLPTEHDDPLNARILAVSEDLIQGFQPRPFHAIAEAAGLDPDLVLERIRAMLEAGVIRRVRQTLLANKLAEGALVAWRVDPARLDAAFEFMSREDPFSGHVVIRSTDREIAGSEYRLWTTLKVPQGQSLAQHCRLLCQLTGADEFILMPAKGIFALGVGHVRRKSMEPGDRADQPAAMMQVSPARLDPAEWNVLLALKEELRPRKSSPTPGPPAPPRPVYLPPNSSASPPPSMPKRSSAASPPSSNTSNLPPPASASPASTASSTGRVPKGMRGTRRRRSRPPFLHDPLLLARGRAPLRQRQHHGRRPRHRKRPRARTQGRHRPAPPLPQTPIHTFHLDKFIDRLQSATRHPRLVIAYTNVFWGGRSEIKPVLAKSRSPAWRDAIGDWQAAAASCPQLRLRLDFNSTLAPHEFRAFAAAIGPELRATIDFIEDPCPFDPQLWHGLQHATGLQLAVDRGSDLPGAANFLGVVKPAVEDAASQIAAAARSGRRLVITSNMDHPLGQLWAALHAARAACAGVLHGPCGLLTHGLFEPLPDIPSPRATNGVLEIPPGPGLGYDREWSALKWEPLR